MSSDPDRISHYRIESSLGQGGMGIVYLAEDLVLRRRVALKVLDPTLEVLAALREAHGKGIIHRDIKCQNVRRTPDGRIKVLDFGLAKIVGGSTITREGSIVGTVAYMSPQQVVGEEVDGRSD